VETKKDDENIRVLFVKVPEVYVKGTAAIDSEMRTNGIEVIYTKDNDPPDAIAKRIANSKIDIIYLYSLRENDLAFLKKLVKEMGRVTTAAPPFLINNKNNNINDGHLRELGLCGIFTSGEKPVEITSDIYSLISINSWVPEVAGSLSGTDINNLHLWGSKCQGCHQVYFPSRKNCPHCFDAKFLTSLPLADMGILRSFVVASVAPPGYEIPHAQGYIELYDNGPVIFSLLTDYGAEANLKIGSEMAIKTIKRGRSRDNKFIIGYRFRPAQKER